MLKFSTLISNCKQGKILSQFAINHNNVVKNTLSSSATASINSDIKKRFYEPEIYSLLKKLTRSEMEKIFRRKKFGKKLKAPEYKFMTTEQLEQAMEKINIRAEQKLQMPPVLPCRKEITDVISKNPELNGAVEHNIVFTDINMGKTNRNRTIVVREPDGTLRKANWDERLRMNAVYFPVAGCKMIPPKLFQPEHLMRLCEEQAFEFILDLACLQFEPDDPEYLRVTETVYDKVDDSQAFDQLRSTRHYGPLLFHLVSQRNIDNLIIENLQTDRLEDAVWAVSLYHLLHPGSVTTKPVSGQELEFIKVYIDNVSKKRGLLEMTLRAYIDTREKIPHAQKS